MSHPNNVGAAEIIAFGEGVCCLCRTIIDHDIGAKVQCIISLYLTPIYFQKYFIHFYVAIL